MALIGDEGVLGVPVAFGLNVSPQRALVDGFGTAWRIEAAPFCREFERNMPLQRVLSRYLYVVMTQLSLTAVVSFNKPLPSV